MTVVPHSRGEWWEAMAGALRQAQQQGADRQIEVQFFAAVLAVLNGQRPELPDEHPYAEAVAAIRDGMAAGGPQVGLPFDAQLIPRTIAALLGGPQDRMAHAQYLAAQATHTRDEDLRALINTIHTALFGGDLHELGQDLRGIYRQAWQAIVAEVERSSPHHQ